VIGVKRTLLSVLVSVLLVGTAVASVWLMASAGVFTGGEPALPGAPSSGSTIVAAPVGAGGPASNYQVGQPRDPFEPLVEETSTTTIAEGSSTSTTTGGSSTSTTAGGSTTTTTKDDSPQGTRVTLLEVREEGTERVAVVQVDGVTYTVGVGDTFASAFKVVSLSASGGVFTYGQTAFTLAVGQSIVK